MIQTYSEYEYHNASRQTWLSRNQQKSWPYPSHATQNKFLRLTIKIFQFFLAAEGTSNRQIKSSFKFEPFSFTAAAGPIKIFVLKLINIYATWNIPAKEIRARWRKSAFQKERIINSKKGGRKTSANKSFIILLRSVENVRRLRVSGANYQNIFFNILDLCKLVLQRFILFRSPKSITDIVAVFKAYRKRKGSKIDTKNIGFRKLYK